MWISVWNWPRTSTPAKKRFHCKKKKKTNPEISIIILNVSLASWERPGLLEGVMSTQESLMIHVLALCSKCWMYLTAASLFTFTRIRDHHFLPLRCLGRGCFQHFYSSSENDSKWSVIKKKLSFYTTSSLQKLPLLKVCALFQQFKALCVMLIRISKVTFKLNQTVSDGNGSFYKPSLKNVEDDTIALTVRRSTLSLSRFPFQQPILSLL